MSKGTQYQSIEATRVNCSEPHPLDNAGLVSRLMFLWVTPILALGNRRQLNFSDIWPLQQFNQSRVVTCVFEPRFHAMKSIIKALISVFGLQAIWIGLLQLVSVGASLSGPIVLNQVVSSIERADSNFLTLLKPIIGLFMIKVLQAFAKTQSDLQNEVMFVQVTSALQSLLYKKALKLDTKSRKEKSIGDLANYFSSDMDQLMSVALFVNDIWITPIQIIILLYLLWQILEWAMIIGSCVLIISFIVTRYLASASRQNLAVFMKKKDSRMKVINEVFGSMQIIKLNAWEERYSKKIEALRMDELNSLWRDSMIRAATFAMNFVAPVALTTLSFASYVLIFEHTLTASKVFTALALFNLMKAPMTRLPQLVAAWVQASVSYKRIMEFLALDERDPTIVSSQISSKDIAIEIQDGSFGWDSDKPFFSNMNLTIS